MLIYAEISKERSLKRGDVQGTVPVVIVCRRNV